jgi:hypothetical protein
MPKKVESDVFYPVIMMKTSEKPESDEKQRKKDGFTVGKSQYQCLKPWSVESESVADALESLDIQCLERREERHRA